MTFGTYTEGLLDATDMPRSVLLGGPNSVFACTLDLLVGFNALASSSSVTCNSLSLAQNFRFSAKTYGPQLKKKSTSPYAKLKAAT